MNATPSQQQSIVGAGKASTAPSAPVGVIGAGRMGLGMVASLLRSGYAVQVCDIDPQQQQRAIALGASIQSTPQALAEQCAQVFIVVVNAKQIEIVLEGVLAAWKECKHANAQLFISSTIAPQDTERFAAQVASMGAQLIDSPISGGPAKAHAGTMSMMLAAPQEALDRAMPLVKAVSGSQFIVSNRVSDAAKAKLVNNMMAAANLVAAAEAFALAKTLDLDQQTLFKLVSASSGQSWMCDERIGRYLAGDMDPRAQLHVLTKDVTLATETAHKAGVSVRMGELARQLMQAGCDTGQNEKDDAIMTELIYALDLHKPYS